MSNTELLILCGVVSYIIGLIGFYIKYRIEKKKIQEYTIAQLTLMNDIINQKTKLESTRTLSFFFAKITTSIMRRVIKMIQLGNLILTLMTLLTMGVMSIVAVIWNIAMVYITYRVVKYIVKLVVKDIKGRLVNDDEV